MPVKDLGFDLFDCHHHVGDVKAFMGDALPHEGPSTAAALAEEMTERIRIMDDGGVRQAVVIPGHGYPRPNGLADTRAINDRIAMYRDMRTDRFPVAIGVAEPLYEADSLPELDRCKNELGIAGISFHTRFQGASMDNPWITKYVARMGELGMVPVLHAMTDNVLLEIQKTFSTFEGTKENSDIAEMCPNLLFDTSLSYNFDFIEIFAKRFGAERVVFGTDLYSPPLGRRISHLVPQILESSLSHDEKVKIFGANLRQLFGVS